MKSIDTLVPDIQGLFSDDKIKLDPEKATEFGRELSAKIAGRIEEERGATTLRMSNLGSKCDRQLWYKINKAELAEPLPSDARIKFLFGDILESMLLYLAKEAGHTVEREQEEVNLFGVKGHIDTVIDGHLIDVKSASSFSFEKFKNGLTAEQDEFGYLTQMDGYLHATPDVQDTGGFLVIDKTLGKITLDKHTKTNTDYEAVIAQKRAVLSDTKPPERAYTPVPDETKADREAREKKGKPFEGNMKLGVACSYCAFKKTCWPGMRTFYYANGPKYLTTVRKEPKVKEA